MVDCLIMSIKTLEYKKVERLEKAITELRRQVSFLLPAENLSDYTNQKQIKTLFKKALKLYPLQ